MRRDVLLQKFHLVDEDLLRVVEEPADQRRIQPVRDRGDEHVPPLGEGDQFIRQKRRILKIEGAIEQIGHAILDRCRQPPRHGDAGLHPFHHRVWAPARCDGN